MKFKPACLVAASMFALAMPTWAHHSRVMYEPTLYLTVTGTVKEFSWRNPHSWLYVTAMGENGESIEWVLEANSVGQLARQGWTSDSIKPGDDITVICTSSDLALVHTDSSRIPLGSARRRRQI